MVVDTWLHVKGRTKPMVNPLLWTYIVGMSIYHFLGAGVFGFIHTLPPNNYYTHGSQITVSHGHLAFFGAYALLNLIVFYYAMPQFKNIRKYEAKLGYWGFWTMCISMLFLGFTFGIAGILQTYLERFLDIGYMTAHFTMMFWFKVAIFFGVCFLAGVLMTVTHLFTLKPAKEREGEQVLEGY